ncbi:MAG: hypothetical protein Q4G07_09000 [Oscillospiraceae bacterium]|nr:hypothetical protein [Oscillospiraceae bacterium]
MAMAGLQQRKKPLLVGKETRSAEAFLKNNHQAAEDWNGPAPQQKTGASPCRRCSCFYIRVAFSGLWFLTGMFFIIAQSLDEPPCFKSVKQRPCVSAAAAVRFGLSVFYDKPLFQFIVSYGL